MPTYESVKFDDLFAGGVKPPTAIAVVVKAGSGVITRGMVLGKTTELGESDLYAGTPVMVPVDSTKTDGSEEPYAILADVEVDATSKDVRAVAYTDGEFNRAALKFGGADTIATHETALRKIGIITKRVVK
ncbi:head decoration protein [Brevibacillus centrosporus]|uniref:head decoration protein n=1 Tax=Brevibacillus centrosporus TaxID=54910 RepID=UPI000F09E458|nr:head decoration protein [Brevibacillus centrosporus]MEC2131824.1 head decoration protein [Brevibacillus centrosporus]RNB64046.1 head decoration protein [Brevibacillus centrosporus]